MKESKIEILDLKMKYGKDKVLVDDISMEFIERRKIPRDKKDEGKRQGEKVDVLDNVSLKIYDGEFVCILGPSGCGKSTLLKIIAGFIRPTSGSIFIDGKEVNGPRPNNIFVFQEGGLFPWLTVYENVAMGIRHLKNEEEKRLKVQEYLEMVDLIGFENHYPHMLSGGMKQRAEIARALAVEPDIMYMDEPFSGLDFLTRLHLREELVNMHLYIQKTILFVTHDIDEAIQLADRLIVLTDRPSKVKMNYEINEPHPRDINTGELQNIRQQLYLSMGVHYTL